MPPEWLPTQINDIYARGQRGTGPHILTGPVAVRGAKPGQVLQVDILDIRLTQPYGYNIVSPLKGMFGAETPMQKTTIIPIDLKTGRAEIAPGLAACRPAPFSGRSASHRRRNGAVSTAGRRINSAATLTTRSLWQARGSFLPIWIEGALFSTGDGHAAQGDGEINQTAIETSLDGHFRLSLRNDIALEWPMAATPNIS